MFSWMFGPVGTRGSAGAGPRPAGTGGPRSVVPSFSQSIGSPPVAFKRSTPLTCFATPVVVSATHNSMPLSLVLVNESRLPSGENPTLPMFAFGGTLTFFSAPSAIDFRVMANTRPVRCWRNAYLLFCSICDRLQSNGEHAAGALLASISFWIDAGARDSVNRLGQVGDSWHASSIEQCNHLVIG